MTVVWFLGVGSAGAPLEVVAFLALETYASSVRTRKRSQVMFMLEFPILSLFQLILLFI